MNSIAIRCFIAFSLLAVFASRNAAAQDPLRAEDYSHPQLNWRTIETPHFTVTYHKDSYNGEKGTERSARIAAKVAEEVYPAITALYNFEPDGKVNIFLKDMHDYSNGAAYFFENRIEIWSPALEFELRGQHDWLRNVITHEFTHIVTLNAAMKFGRTMPAIYLQAFGYETARRPDVLYGFPNVLISYPFAGINMPFWMAEGVAQYQRSELAYETWDSHRDMILRSLVLDHKLQSLDWLSNFASKKRIEYEFTYNAGFALTRYLAEKYGEKKLEELCKNFASVASLNVHTAMEKTFEKPSTDVYNEWKTFLEQDYAARTKTVKENLVEGKQIEPTGFANYYPLFAPNGKLYYTSNGDADFGGHAIVELDLRYDSTRINTAVAILAPEHKTYRELLAQSGALIGESGELAGGNKSGICKMCGFHFGLQSGEDDRRALIPSAARVQVSPDGKTLLYHRYGGTSGEVQNLNDVFAYDLASKAETRITIGNRLETPSFSPDGKTIVATDQHDGTGNLIELAFDADKSKQNFRRLTKFANGEQVLTPIYSADGSKIYFALGVRNRRRLMELDRATGVMTAIPTGVDSSLADTDERDPALSPDGKHLLFASDRTGIFNIYRYNFETGQINQLTNVLGGAFMPGLDKFGNLAFGNFTSGGYKISVLNNPQPLVQPDAAYRRKAAIPVKVSTAPVKESVIEPANKLPDSLQSQAMLASAGGTLLTQSATDSLTATPIKQFDWNKMNGYDDTQLPAYPDREYEKIFTSLQILPIIRFDAYSKSQGSFLADAWRSTKVGVAVGSSELLNNLNFFASLLLAPGSIVSNESGFGAVLELERDAYLSLEYNEVSFLPASMLTKFTLDIYHQTRNVKDGAKIVQGNDSATTNVFYYLTEIDLSMRFRIPVENIFFKRSNFRLQLAYSPYASRVGSFYWEPVTNIISSGADTYYIGRAASLFWNLNLIERSANTEINPVGLLSRVRVDFESDQLQDSIEVTPAGTLKTVYKDFNFIRLSLDLNLHIPLPAWKHTLTLRSYSAFNFTSQPQDLFFYNFISGLLGMRGYEFYAIGGEKATMLHAEYRVPLLEKINIQFAQFYFDKLYASTYFDIGAAWNGGAVPSLAEFRKDVGVELRLEAPSFYLFPTRVFFSATYGLDRFTQDLGEQFVTSSGQRSVSYGGEWRFHFGILFDFNFLSDDSRNASRGLVR